MQGKKTSALVKILPTLLSAIVQVHPSLRNCQGSGVSGQFLSDSVQVPLSPPKPGDTCTCHLCHAKGWGSLVILSQTKEQRILATDHVKSVSPFFFLLKKMVTDGRSILVSPPYFFPLKYQLIYSSVLIFSLLQC